MSLRAVLCSSDPRPSAYQLSSAVIWNRPNVCSRAFHTFLCLVSKLVLTWFASHLTASPSHMLDISTQTSHLTCRREHCRTTAKDMRALLTHCAIFLAITIEFYYLTHGIYILISRWFCAVFSTVSVLIVKMLLRVFLYLFLFFLAIFSFLSCLCALGKKEADNAESITLAVLERGI